MKYGMQEFMNSSVLQNGEVRLLRFHSGWGGKVPEIYKGTLPFTDLYIKYKFVDLYDNQIKIVIHIPYIRLQAKPI